VFFEAKMLYRTAVEEVPPGDYVLPLGKARVVRQGTDVTVVGWGQQVLVLELAVRWMEGGKGGKKERAGGGG
jgi:2-oxoisovalerate dehydrogenase E1 component beta subunit